MSYRFDPRENYEQSRERVGWVPLEEATPETYERIGYKSGLEVHQQLKTKKKLFCRCPAGIYQDPDDYDAEVIRHMRPTLSELGEYDGTALMEFKTKKNVIYRIKGQTACTYDIDDTPPFPLDREALEYALKISLMLKLNIVGELHITRKQYLDGSIPTGFQRTGIIGIEGEIPLRNKKVRIMQLSIEEDACREVSDVGHWRIFMTDRLGMPLIETVTYPELLTPWECAEAAQYLRFLARSSGVARVGIGAAREDVNVSVRGGTRVEIKGVSHIKLIPRLTHTEAFRQVALLQIRDILSERIKNRDEWQIASAELEPTLLPREHKAFQRLRARGWIVAAVNLPKFGGILSYFTQPDKMFANELSDRLKVIACLERPNLLHSEQFSIENEQVELEAIRKLLKSADEDAQVVVWGPPEDVETAIGVIEERCRLAMEGVPNETRKSLADGTTVFERVLPGPDRMYPDTDSAPIPIRDSLIEDIRKTLPLEVVDRVKQLREWGAPEDTHTYILRNNLVPLMERIIADCGHEPKFVSTFLGHTLKSIEGRIKAGTDFSYERVYELCRFAQREGLTRDILAKMLPVVYRHPNMHFDSVLTTIEFHPLTFDEVLEFLPSLVRKAKAIGTTANSGADVRWIMGQLRRKACGNVALPALRNRVEEELKRG